MSRKTLLFVSLLVGFALILTACAPTEVIKTVIVTEVVEGETVEKVITAVPEPAEPVKKTIVLDSEMFSPPDEQSFFINEILKPFEEETGITVNFQIIEGSDMRDRITVQQETGHVTTDAILAFNGRFAWYTDPGYVVSLDDATSD